MTSGQRQYWAMRTDKNYTEEIYKELKQGHLRQGWGYLPEQDLREVVPRIKTEWNQLSEEQQEIFRHRKMYFYEGEGIQFGDYILVPRMPGPGKFTLLKVKGEYYFEMLHTGDHGHILPVEVLTPDGVAHYNKHVDACIRRTMRSQSRMWSLYGYEDSIDKIIQAHQIGENLLDESDTEARLSVAVESAIEHAREIMITQLGPKLDEQFKAAEWEKVIKRALERLYPEAMAEVRHTGGPSEQGADIVVKITNHFTLASEESTDWIILVQVKDYQNTIYGTDAIEQLRQAKDSYEHEGKLLSLVLMTNAEKADDKCIDAAKQLEKEIDVPVSLVFRKELLNLIANGMLYKKT